jgi:hypothetical protein
MQLPCCFEVPSAWPRPDHVHLMLVMSSPKGRRMFAFRLAYGVGLVGIHHDGRGGRHSLLFTLKPSA